jgi:hypothetical protein
MKFSELRTELEKLNLEFSYIDDSISWKDCFVRSRARVTNDRFEILFAFVGSGEDSELREFRWNNKTLPRSSDFYNPNEAEFELHCKLRETNKIGIIVKSNHVSEGERVWDLYSRGGSVRRGENCVQRLLAEAILRDDPSLSYSEDEGEDEIVDSEGNVVHVVDSLSAECKGHTYLILAGTCIPEEIKQIEALDGKLSDKLRKYVDDYYKGLAEYTERTGGKYAHLTGKCR